MDASINFAEPVTEPQALDTVLPHDLKINAINNASDKIVVQTHELGVRLLALESFFNLQNHPLSETERAKILTRDFTNEMRVVQDELSRCLHLIHALNQPSAFLESLRDADTSSLLFEKQGGGLSDPKLQLSLRKLTEVFNDAAAICHGLLEARSISLHAWAGFGKMLIREINASESASRLMRDAKSINSASVQPELLEIAKRAAPDAFSADLMTVFSRLTQLLERLRFTEKAMRRDQPLKQAIQIFTLVNEETRGLLQMIEKRALRIEGLDGNVFDALDGIAYAIQMELRKAFEHELVGICAVRQAPALYAKVENAHGVLRDCFQQSIVAIAQIFDASLDGTKLFRAFQTKLQQSIILRRDLWNILQLVQRAEKEREKQPVGPLLEKLIAFRDGSLRFLMYKDWESYERFLEEITAARGAAELTPVLHRFGAYLETLFGQINMRAVLAEHPFDYPV